MKNTTKRILAVAVCIVMTVAAAPLGGLANLDLHDLFNFKAEAATEIPECPYGADVCWESGSHCHFKLTNGGVKVFGHLGNHYTGYYENLSIPSSYCGYPVTVIGLFHDSYIKSITIPSSIKTIGESAFCKSKIENITIENGVETIEDYAFSETELKNITIPDSVTSLGQQVFTSSSVASVDLGNGLTDIVDYTFYGCENLINVTLGKNIKTIGDSAFCGCKILTNLKFPDSVTTIGENAFRNCDSITDIKLPQGITILSESVFSGCTNLENISIPGSVTTIGNRAFSECDSLTDVLIPASVISIGTSAFTNCKNLETITVDKNNENYSSDGGILYDKGRTRLMQYPIGSKRASLIIPDGVTSIGENAFLGCKNLEYIHIPESVTSIGFLAFTSTGDMYICSTSEDGYIKEYAETYGKTYVVCHHSEHVTTTKPVVTEPATTKPVEVPTTTKPVVTEPSTTKPVEIPTTTKPIETTKPVVEPTKPVATTKPVETTKPEPTTKPSAGFIFKILKPSVSVIKYGETLILHTNLTSISADEKIEWSVEGNGVTIKPSADGLTCAVTSTATGDVTVTAKYTDANGIEHISEQEIKSNASFWQKIVSFFKNLFGINRIIEQVFKF